jgi:hypothetical protein
MSAVPNITKITLKTDRVRIHGKYDADVSQVKTSGSQIFVIELKYLLTELCLTETQHGRHLSS